MRLYRIQAILLRHLLLTFRVFGNVINLMYWPLLNIILWGFNSVWSHTTQQSSHSTLTLLTALMLWQVLFRANMEICMSLWDELMSYDFTNLFSTPLKLYEWMVAVIILGFLKSIFTLFFATGCIWVLYGINVLTTGWYLLPFIFLVIITGWSAGFLTATGIVYWGKSVHELIWVVVWMFVPLSGIFYSIKVLPSWVQYIAWCIPQSHIFESLRGFMMTGVFSLHSFFVSLGLSLLYFALALLLFKKVFEKSRSKGFARLENS